MIRPASNLQRTSPHALHVRSPERIESRFRQSSPLRELEGSTSTLGGSVASSRVSSLSDGSDNAYPGVLRKGRFSTHQSLGSVKERNGKTAVEETLKGASSLKARKELDDRKDAFVKKSDEFSEPSSGGALGIVLHEFLCPLSGELPTDPVTASDGVVYEREAIMKWMRGKPRDKLASPSTGEHMSTRIFPAAQVRNAIERAVKSDAISGPEVEKWVKRVELEREVERTRTRASLGDTEAMYHLGVWYQCGKKGMKRNCSRAFDWYQSSAYGGNVRGMAAMGFLLVKGEGTKCNRVEGVSLVTFAATEQGGVDTAAFCLANWYYEGLYGLPRSEKWAMFWLNRVVSGKCSIRDMDDRGLERAQALLNKLQKKTPSLPPTYL